MRPRFRLRTLLIVMALVAAACYWQIARPTILAKRFVEVVNTGTNLAATDALFSRGEVTLTDCVQDWSFDLFKMGYSPEQTMVDLTAYVLPRTWDDLVRGQRHVHVDAKSALQTSWEYVATRRHIENATFGTYQLPPGLPSAAAPIDNR